MFYKTLLVIFIISVVTALPSANSGTVSPPTPFAIWMQNEFDIAEQDYSPDGRFLFEPPARTKPYPLSMLLNPGVENQIEYFMTGGRTTFQNWLAASARYVPVMKEIFRENNLPEDLVYMAMIESGFDPDAVSWANAVGPWQFMPATAEEYGLEMDRWVDERKDPVKSTYAAAAYLKDLHNLFGSWPLALAAYNAGAAKVQHAVLGADSGDPGSLYDSRFILRETRNYVPRFIAAVIIAENPGAFGFTHPPAAPFLYDEVVIRKPTALGLIARCAGSTIEEIKMLNPELMQEVTPPNSAGYVLRIPRGAKQTFLANLAGPPEQPLTWEIGMAEGGELSSGTELTPGIRRQEDHGVFALSESGNVWSRHIAFPRGQGKAGIPSDM